MEGVFRLAGEGGDFLKPMASGGGQVMMAEKAQSPVMDLLRQEDVVLHRLEKLAMQQREMVASSDLGPLLTLLDDRKRLSAELAEIERALAPMRRNWGDIRLTLAQSEREMADDLLSFAGQRLRRLMEGDEEDGRKLCIRKQAVAHTLQAAGFAKHALSAYRDRAEPANRLDYKDITE